MNEGKYPFEDHPPEQITSALLWLMCRAIVEPSCPCVHKAVLQHINMLANHPKADSLVRTTCVQLLAQMFDQQREKEARIDDIDGAVSSVEATVH